MEGKKRKRTRKGKNLKEGQKGKREPLRRGR